MDFRDMEAVALLCFGRILLGDQVTQELRFEESMLVQRSVPCLSME